VAISIRRKQTCALIDTGSHYNCLNADFARRMNISIRPPKVSSLPRLAGANGNPLSVSGVASVSIKIASHECLIDFVVVDNLYHNVILGLDGLQSLNAVIDVPNALLSIANNFITVPLIKRFSARNILRTTQCVTVNPLHKVTLPVRISQQYKLGPSIIEPLIMKRSWPILVAKVFVDPSSHITVCQLVNLSDKPFVVPARMAIATISPADLLSVDDPMLQDADEYVSNVEAEPSFDEKLQVLREKGFKLSQDDLTSSQFAELIDLLFEYRQLFATDMKELPGVKGVEYDIKIQPGAHPKRQRQYRYPPNLRKVIREQLDEWEKVGIVQEGDPTWIHPIVLVRKKSLTGNPNEPPKYRACLDLRAINKVISIESYPMPTFNTIVESFGDPSPSYYSTMDAVHGYLQVSVTEQSSKLLGLESDLKTYVFCRVPFGLSCSPYWYQKLMNKLLHVYFLC